LYSCLLPFSIRSGNSVLTGLTVVLVRLWSLDCTPIYAYVLVMTTFLHVFLLKYRMHSHLFYSCYLPRRSHHVGLSEVEAPKFSRQSAHRWRYSCQPYERPTGPLPPWIFLILTSVRDWVDPRAIVRLVGLGQLKNPITSPGIEPEAFRIAAQRLNQPRYRVPAVIMHLVMLVPSAFSYFLPLRSKCFLISLFPDTHNLSSSVNMKDKISHS
jgi:hypothetical protein